MKKPTILALSAAVVLSAFGACTSSDHPNNMPSAANGTIHGAPKNGMKSGPDAASTMR